MKNWLLFITSILALYGAIVARFYGPGMWDFGVPTHNLVANTVIIGIFCILLGLDIWYLRRSTPAVARSVGMPISSILLVLWLFYAGFQTTLLNQQSWILIVCVIISVCSMGMLVARNVLSASKSS